MSSAPGRALRSTPRSVVAVVGFVLLTAVVALGWRLWSGPLAPEMPTGRAEWIWRPDGDGRAVPVAFYAVCDFALEAVPERAELLVQGDEEYLLYLNGIRVASNVYRPGAPVDVIEVAPLLVAGNNRVLVELRSGRGEGGFLAAVHEPASGRELMVSDPGWRYIDTQEGGLLDGSTPIDDAPRMRSWGRPPTGRWGLPRRGPLRPRFDASVAGEEPVLPVRFARLGRPLRWRPFPGLGDRFARRSPAALRPGLVYDFGREVYGYLSLGAVWRAPRPAALLFTGAEPFDPLAVARQGAASSPTLVAPAVSFDGGVMVLTVPRRRTWDDAVPRRFRYAAVVGMRGLQDAWVEPVTAGAEEAGGGDGGNGEEVAAGVFGIEPPPLRTPVEHEVWRELQRLADLSGRKRR